MNSKLFGTTYGGFYYPEDLKELNENSIIYCFGAGEDITHDVILSYTLNCKVQIFDPTPRAIEHVKYVKNVLAKKECPIDSKRFGGGDPDYWKIILSHPAYAENLVLNEYGLYTNDTSIPFYFPKNKNHVSCSIKKIGRTEENITVEVKSLNTIMKELNHDHIDLLKIDVENIECDVLEKMLLDKIYPTYLSVDFDLMKHDRNRCKEIINKLINCGYKIIKQSGQDFSFVKYKNLNVIRKINEFSNITLSEWQKKIKPLNEIIVQASNKDGKSVNEHYDFSIGMHYSYCNLSEDEKINFQFGPHNKLVLCAMATSTDQKRRGKCNINRGKILRTLKNNNISNKRFDSNSYFNNLADYMFVISPEGNGIDCHRHYEALLSGTIPIIEDNEHMRRKYINLPILYTKDYSEINEDYLKNKYEEMINKKYNFFNLFLSNQTEENQKLIKQFGNYWCKKRNGVNYYL